MPRESSAARIVGTAPAAVLHARAQESPVGRHLVHLGERAHDSAAASRLAVRELDGHGVALQVALELLGRALDDDLPRLTIASRSASWSASSR